MLFQQIHLKKISISSLRILACILLLISAHTGVAQDRCGTESHTTLLREKNIIRETKDVFENWMQKKLKSTRSSLSTQRTQAGPYQVPVVVHVIHNGEAIGTGVNISDAQILSQMDVLNADFNRLNADAVNTPAEFLPVASAFDIEFVLAKQTPDGLSTNGIVRVQGSQTQWTINDNYALKAQSYWPAEDYLNIWVTNMGGGLIGFAQFPVSPLPGLENASNSRLTDGVAIHYRAFGSLDDGAFDLDSRYNRGRTTTHEVGHFFGLRHLSGDANNCTATDYVDDTPAQNGNTTGCPAHPKNSCTTVPGNDMFQNYLDYTNDVCMNLFTQDQVDRMEVVIESSPRRLSLLTSPGLLTPAPVANDLGIKAIIGPASTECTGLIIPIIEVVNAGNNSITSAQVVIKKDGSIIETMDFPLNLAPDATTLLVFPTQNFGSVDFSFSVEIVLTNGGADGNPNNNVWTQTVAIQPSIALPFFEPFNTTPTDWKITNPDQGITWTNVNAPKETNENQAMQLDFFDYNDNYGEVDILTSPVFDLSGESVALLTFDVAHARFKNSLSNDALRVVVLTGCSSDYLSADVVYYKEGAALQTVAPLNTEFIPSNESEWRKEVVDLSPYLGQSNVQIAIIGINDYGNNLYLDNVNVISSAVEDLAILQVISPGPVSCEHNPAPILEIQNQGSTVITNFKVDYGIDGATPLTTMISGIDLLPGAVIKVSAPSQTLSNGEHQLFFALKEPNGLVDINPFNSEREYLIKVDQSEDLIPLRENFDSGFTGWTVVNPTAGENWETTATNYNVSMFFNAFENTTLDDEAWLVSPTLDFSNTTQASVFFDLSYGYRTNTNDRFQVLASIDCGQTYNIVLFNRTGENLKTVDSESSWIPSSENDWTKTYINLNSLAGVKEARIAFVFSNDNGNNVFVDNIEFYISDDPSPPETGRPYVVYMTGVSEFGDFKITFDLETRQDVQLQVVDMMGRTFTEQLLPNTLNQTYSVSLTDASTGIYIVRLRLNGSYFATKVYVAK